MLIVSHLHVAEQLEKQQLSRNTRVNLKRQTTSYTHCTKHVGIELPSTVLERSMKLWSYHLRTCCSITRIIHFFKSRSQFGKRVVIESNSSPGVILQLTETSIVKGQ